MTRGGYRIGIDVGGTFTDFAVVDVTGGEAAVSFKVPSTSSDPARAVLSGLAHAVGDLVPADAVEAVVHGTTIGLNTIVQRAGAHVGLVVTRGFRDVMQLTQRLPEEYDLRQPHLPSLVAREDIVEIDARLDARGAVLARPDGHELDRVADELRTRGVTAVALSVLHGYADPAFEARLAEEIERRLPGVPVSAAALLWPQIREYERTALATINAYVAPLMRRYLGELRTGIRDLGVDAPLFVTTSAGGCIGVESAIDRPVETLLSGPASGVMAGALLSRATGADLISLDMGGTSTDISVISGGQPAFATRSEVGGIPLITPVVDVNAIGTGGGSIVWVDGQGLLRVGPRSAGADPGPIAFGRGGEELTLTDVYLLAGILSPASFEHRFGALRLERAREEAERIARVLGHEGDDPVAFTTAGALELSTALAASELRKMLARHGRTASQFAIAPFGGAGPVAGALLAEEVGSAEVIVPLNAGTFCALGAAWSDIRRELLRGVGRPLAESAETIAALAETLRRDGVDWATAQLGDADAARRVTCRTSFSARYRGQVYELHVAIPDDDLPLDAAELAERFHTEHAREFGYRDTASPVEAIAVRAVVIAAAPGEPSLAAHPADGRPGDRDRERRMLVGGAWRTVPVRGLADLEAGGVAGPAAFDLPDSTILVPDGWTAAPSDGAVRLRRTPAAVAAPGRALTGARA
ncbi:hydantoinase/oxoprolinase family protein [Microbacterium betulae]|uniref:Hydantoinase/oxoprolinase family protein n=1 Tax=Microbacterium betulae TaxID=2981139 RepID=A0AA97I649_9MICO|nr:hydantoinase/oxoprolinase family protein [Microbacterium sp. AB]WOF23444.1 hydantoinase/oxoprolinase family protein [Microbacterium sp. AB]